MPPNSELRLTLVHEEMLQMVAIHQPVAISDLVEVLGKQKQSIDSILTQMESKELIARNTRIVRAAGRTVVTYCLTDSGEEYLIATLPKRIASAHAALRAIYGKPN